MMKSLVKKIIICCLLLSCGWSLAEIPSWFLSSKPTRQKWGFFPNISRNDTYGYMGGARLVIYPVQPIGYYTDIDASLSEDMLFSTNFTYRRWEGNGNQWNFKAIYNGFDDVYYGEGSQTLVKNQQYIPSHKLVVNAEYLVQIRESFYGGGFTGFNYRREKQGQFTFPQEALVPFGLILRYDSRDHQLNPTRGEFYQVRSWLLAQSASPLFLEGEIRLFFPVLEDIVLAQRVQVGLTFTENNSYLFRFSLGGPHKLRGFQQNRFRGTKYYLSQTELRYTPFSFLTLAGFVDLGVADKQIMALLPRYSFGGGVRIGIPPDYNNKLRIEWGEGEDQHNFVITMFHPF